MTSKTYTPVVMTKSGPVRGRINDGVATYLGLPYAAPPTRFELPTYPAGWTQVRDASERGPTAPHTVRPFPNLDVVPLVGTGSDGSDGDYLRLNLWAPENAKDAPVMFWVHGGGFVVGSKDAPISDGTAFAQSGVICVAINYRMGIDGFLPVPGAPTNLGLRDMLFALRWVKNNIAAFGGDPSNVTAFGESAGAMAIANLVTSPLAKGLFRRAIHSERAWRDGPGYPGCTTTRAQARSIAGGLTRCRWLSQCFARFRNGCAGKGRQAGIHRPA
ncbi:carboxylesterase family protein [Novosphingobium sp. ES2-1]|uniref:carboxylesterase family protein n=1 Tax=Novosphingobium sp. ES2-1 TaxID=2780074 RepID=UPI002104217A|nr:carboxylesterase family protein [Novosphingobium sp. ES2-1]